MNPQDILLELNTKQRVAVEQTDGPMLIIAGAGTGKTKVITSKIAYLIASKKAKPSEILALTFTDKASAEMTARVDEYLPYGENDVDIFTFHAFADTVLKEHALDLGIAPDYTVMTKAEEIYFFQKHLFDFPLSYYRPLSNPTKFIQILLQYFSRLIDEDISPLRYNEFIETLAYEQAHGMFGEFGTEDVFAEYFLIHKELALCYSMYEKVKKENGVVNFADLIANTLNLLRDHPLARSYYQQKYKYILVDEYQDTNFTQNEIVSILASKHHNICVCGDDDQSIYKFRGASIANILTFEETYPDLKKAILTNNYRSAQPILDASYALISNNNPNRLEIKAKINKKLVAQQTFENQKITIIGVNTVLDEMQLITQTIQDQVDQGLSYNDFAVLIRSNAQAQEVIKACKQAGIPYIASGLSGLYETEEIRILLALLYSIARSDDNVNLFYLAKSFVYTIGMKTLIDANNIARLENKSLWAVLKSDQLDCTIEDIKQIATLVADIEHYAQLTRIENIGSMLLAFLKDKQYFEQFSKNPDSTENIKHFFEKIDLFLSTAQDANSIQDFCNYIDYSRQMGDEQSENMESATNGVSIFTIHKAKGMEFRVVFMIDLIDGRFPSRSMKDPIEIPQRLMREQLPQDDFHKQEERRLFYVGMTRAKEQLYLLWAEDYFQKTLKKPSVFLYETNLLEAVKKKSSIIISKENNMQKKQLSTDNLVITQSDIEDYLTCPKKYAYSHIEKLQPLHNPQAAFGSLVHGVIQEILKARMQGIVFAEDIDSYIDSLWSSKGYLSKEHHDALYIKAKETIKNFLLYDTTQATYIEKKFSILFDSITTIAGRWDCLTKDGIIDFKTGHVKDVKEATQKAKESIQLKIYTWAYEKTFGSLPENASLYFVSNRIIGTYKPTAKTLKEANETLEQVITGIRKKAFDPDPVYLACEYCPFRTICPYTLAT